MQKWSQQHSGPKENFTHISQDESIYKLISEGPLQEDATRHSIQDGSAGCDDQGTVPAESSRTETKPRKKVVSHQDSHQIANIFCPSRGIRDDLQRKGIEPKDHAKEHRMAISQASTQNHLRKQDESLASSMRLLATSKTSPHRTRPSVSAVSSMAGSDGGLKSDASSSSSQNHVLKNMLNAAASVPKRRQPLPSSEDTSSFRHKENGRVPAYLQRRKEEMALQAEKRREDEERKKLPPGMVLMHEEERQRMLESLAESKLKVEAKIRALPLRMGLETPSQLKVKKALEDQHTTIEDAIKKFSRPKVYIKEET